MDRSRATEVFPDSLISTFPQQEAKADSEEGSDEEEGGEEKGKMLDEAGENKVPCPQPSPPGLPRS